MNSIFTEITLNHYLCLSAILFGLGLTGVMVRRNIIVVYMSLELMLNAANLALISFTRFQSTSLDGHVIVFIIITVAAAEVAVGLALIVALFRLRKTTNVHDLTSLKF